MFLSYARPLFDGRGEGAQQLGSIAGGHRPPGPEGVLCLGDDLVSLRLGGRGDFAESLAGGRIDQRVGSHLHPFEGAEKLPVGHVGVECGEFHVCHVDVMVDHRVAERGTRDR